MCIVLLTTAHPDYAVIIIDNRDEFILRPTSRPHWWSHPNQEILSSRDLQRAEQGTWLGVTKSGKFAVLTNYQETDTDDKEHPVQGVRSRGSMVTGWLTSHNDETTPDFVRRLLEGDGVKGVGGFSLLCGTLRRRTVNGSQGLEPLAIISNRAGEVNDVPWIGESRGTVHGLSNTRYDDSIQWPKVEIGKEKLLEAVTEVVDKGLGEDELVSKLFGILDSDTLPAQNGESFEAYIPQLRKSIFIPSFGSVIPPPSADVIATANPEVAKSAISSIAAEAKLNGHASPGELPIPNNWMTGIYGTQRQTVILVDWEGKVHFRERALFDAEGRAIPRGKGDMNFEFNIDGWNKGA